MVGKVNRSYIASMTTEQLVEIMAAAEQAGNTRVYHLAWVGLGYHRHPAFLPATEEEKADAIKTLAGMKSS